MGQALVEAAGHVEPGDLVRHLRNHTYQWRDIDVTFGDGGLFVCRAAPGKVLLEESIAEVPILIEAMATALSAAVMVSIDSRTVIDEIGTVKTVTQVLATVSIPFEASMGFTIDHTDGSVSRNPVEYAWLAELMIQDPSVRFTGELLREATRATERTTVIDYIAIEVMKKASGGEASLAADGGVTKDKLRELKRRLQQERHVSGYLQPEPDFSPRGLHLEVVGLFLGWAKSRTKTFSPRP